MEEKCKAKRIRIFAVILICAVCVIGGVVRAVSEARLEKAGNEIYHDWGEILNPNAASEEGQATMVIRARDFSVSQEEWNQVTATFALSGYSEREAEHQARTLLTEKYAMYHQAVEHGFQASREDALAVIAETKKGLAENAGDFESFLAGIQMTSEEYWDSQVENIMIHETIGLYQNALRQSFLAENGLTDDTESTEALWNAYYQEQVDRAVAEQEIVCDF